MAANANVGAKAMRDGVGQLDLQFLVLVNVLSGILTFAILVIEFYQSLLADECRVRPRTRAQLPVGSDAADSLVWSAIANEADCLRTGLQDARRVVPVVSATPLS